MTPDSQARHWSHRLPKQIRPYAALARWDRPVGYWLLALPGWIGIAFTGLTDPLGWAELWLGALILLGAVAMRGAGCTYNDIVDRDLDAKVARTRARPLPSGAVTVRHAWMWLFVQCGVGLMVLVLLPTVLSQIVALCALPLVAAYPFMKRITGFPQVWLGLTFNWAVLVGFAAVTGSLSFSVFLLYAGLAFWTLGYDTIYALQDIEDDQMAGIKSSAISFGPKVQLGVAVSYMVFLGLVLAALFTAMLSLDTSPDDALHDTYYVVVHGHALLLLLLPLALHFAWQIATLKRDDPARALTLFKSNVWAGALLFVIILSSSLYIRLTIASQTSP